VFADYLVDARACSQLRCRYGAVCRLRNGVAECDCPATCQDIQDSSILHGDRSLVCGSDGKTYGSACQLVLFACRLQKDITVAHYGHCQGNVHVSLPLTDSKITANQTVNDGVAHSKNPKKCTYHVTFDLDLDIEHTADAC